MLTHIPHFINSKLIYLSETNSRTYFDNNSRADALLDFVMLQLRLSDGLALADVVERMGGTGRGARAAEAVLEAVRPHVLAGTALLEGEGPGRRIRLADPDGFLVSNDIISDVFAALD